MMHNTLLIRMLQWRVEAMNKIVQFHYNEEAFPSNILRGNTNPIGYLTLMIMQREHYNPFGCLILDTFTTI